ncbi:unnamed protein product [Lymnaea stagnalis]|uniref:3 beta-hydroxysteroid dehydrogenase n=1 Tax=Lymnaea stagnalis TaxID=6523 RepID=A0A7G7LIE0_LYMST|nr:3 beta-hydroxysteroid dehydrogenase [Lymnaea stagnalis]
MDSGKSPTTPSTITRAVGGKETGFGQVLLEGGLSGDKGCGDPSQVTALEVEGAINDENSGNASAENSPADAGHGDVTSLAESEFVTGTVSPIADFESQQTGPVDGDTGNQTQDSENRTPPPGEISTKFRYQLKTSPTNADTTQNRTGSDIHTLTENLRTSFGDNFGMFKCPFSDQALRTADEKSERALIPGRISSNSGTVSEISETPPHNTCGATEQDNSSGTSLVGVGRHELSESKMAADSASDKGWRNGDGDIVVVTGGNGFFGQHIVKMLHLRAPHVSEIWVLDIAPFEQKLDYQPTKKVKSIIGDVTDARFTAYLLRGATSVIHVAGIMSWGTFPDMDGMEKVNVKGTLNVLNACLKNSVKRLVYCSTVDVAVGSQPIRGGDETNTRVPDKFLFPGYPDTKYHGERLILGSGRPKRADGGQLQTAVLRANVCYGELDQSYVTNALRMAEQNKGVLYQVGDGSAMFQQAYVGNTAWAFVCADSAMRENPELSNEIFYIPDNTPIQNSFNFIRPYLEARGFQLSPRPINFSLLHGAVSLAEVFVKGLSPLVRLSLPFQSYTLAYINTDLYFNGSKARRVLNFEPIYSPNEARAASMIYYKTVDLDGGPTT